MSKKNLVVTVHPFTYKEINVERHLEDAGILTMRNYAIFEKLHCLLNFNETEKIGELDAPTGYTIPFTYGYLAEKTGMSKRSAISAVKELADNNVIDKEEVILKDATGVRKVNRARILYFDGYAQELKDNPDHPKHKFIALRAEQSEREELRSEASINRGEDDAEGIETVAPKQEYKESLENPTVSGYPGPNEESEKRGDFSNDERQEQEEESPKEKDVQPNAQIGDANDLIAELTQAKSMNASQPDDSVESFVLSFNDAFGYETPVVMDLKLARAISELQGHLGGILSAASIEMPPLLFFKHCFRETNNRLASGDLTEKPKHPNFYRNTPSGKEIIELCVKKLGSENRATRDLERTKARNQALLERKPPSESEKKLTSDLIANLKPISPDEAKQLRRLRE